MKDGQIFKTNKNKVFMFTKTLYGYDDYYANDPDEFNRLLSAGLIKRFKEGELSDYLYDYLPESPK